jgi:hypothetical protein
VKEEPQHREPRTSIMRKLLFLIVLLSPSVLPAQTTAIAAALQTGSELQQAMSGNWTGVLEYRDYSEPATSTKRVKLPTWLSVASSAERLTFDYTYDDGPGKVVGEKLIITFDVAGSNLQITNDHGHTELYKVDGYDRLRDGHGDITLLGPTTDNNRPAESRIAIGVRRKLITWVEEVRPTSDVPFAFRHSYVFTRAEAPKLTPSKPAAP